MATGVDMAAVAALVGDPARANMLAAMLDGRAHTATELAQLAGIAAPTASGHLAKLSHAQLIGVVAQGRHRYYRLASAEIGRMLEGIMVVAGELAPTIPRATPRIDPALRRARTCYDHIAGELGVAIADGLVRLGVVDLTVDGAAVTEAGRARCTPLASSLMDRALASASIVAQALSEQPQGRVRGTVRAIFRAVFGCGSFRP
jgi:DNA-binding transcriptional ArsR family regulator